MRLFKMMTTFVCIMLIAVYVFAAVSPTDEWVGGIRRWRIQSDGDLTAALDSTYDFGETGYRPAVSYLDSVDIKPERGQLAVTDDVTDEYAYGVKIDSDTFFTGGVTTKSYLLWLEGDRPSGSAASGDSNDAYLKIHGKNKADNSTTFIYRGINSVINNSTSGIVGTIDNMINSKNSVDATSAVNLRGLQVTAENYTSLSTEFGGIDIRLLNEHTPATTEYGLRIQNLNASLATAIDAGIIISDAGANTGFTAGIDLSGASIVQADVVTSGGPKVFSGTAANGNAVYAEVGAYDATGSIYISTAGLYHQVANAGAATDWYKCTTTDAD